MIKKTKIYVLLLFLVSLVSCKKNSLELNINDEIQPDFLKIEIIDFNEKTTVYKNGSIKEIPNFYGENDWKIYYKDSLLLKFRHFKTNRNSVHKYIFNLNYTNENFKYDIKIMGSNDMKISNIED